MVSAKNKLRQRIENAFATVPYPGDDHITSDKWGSDPESAGELRDALRGLHWRDLLQKNDKWFRVNHDALVCLTKKAYLFYLPAFLIRTIDRGSALDLTPEWIIYSLEPPGDDYVGLMDFYNERTKQFTTEQRSALVEFLNHLRRQIDVRDPLAKHIRAAKSALKVL